MLSNASVHPTVPTTDLERARDFYEGVLGLDLVMDRGDSVVYKCSDTYLTVYQRPTASSGQHTVASFNVDNLDDVVDEMLDRGIVFDTFEVPGVELDWDDRGIVQMEDMRGGWFKDPDGNVLAIGEFPME